jgi:hypothetical protein
MEAMSRTRKQQVRSQPFLILANSFLGDATALDCSSDGWVKLGFSSLLHFDTILIPTLYVLPLDHGGNRSFPDHVVTLQLSLTVF